MNRVLSPSSNFELILQVLGAQDPPSQLHVIIVLDLSFVINYSSPTLYTMTQGNWNGQYPTQHIFWIYDSCMRILWQLTNKKVSIDNLRGGHNYNVQNLTKYLAWSQQNLHPHIFRCTPETDPVLTPPSRVRLPKTVSGKQMVLHENFFSRYLCPWWSQSLYLHHP